MSSTKIGRTQLWGCLPWALLSVTACSGMSESTPGPGGERDDTATEDAKPKPAEVALDYDEKDPLAVSAVQFLKGAAETLHSDQPERVKALFSGYSVAGVQMFFNTCWFAKASKKPEMTCDEAAAECTFSGGPRCTLHRLDGEWRSGEQLWRTQEQRDAVAALNASYALTWNLQPNTTLDVTVNGVAMDPVESGGGTSFGSIKLDGLLRPGKENRVRYAQKTESDAAEQPMRVWLRLTQIPKGAARWSSLDEKPLNDLIGEIAPAANGAVSGEWTFSTHVEDDSAADAAEQKEAVEDLDARFAAFVREWKRSLCAPKERAKLRPHYGVVDPRSLESQTAQARAIFCARGDGKTQEAMRCDPDTRICELEVEKEETSPGRVRSMSGSFQFRLVQQSFRACEFPIDWGGCSSAGR